MLFLHDNSDNATKTLKKIDFIYDFVEIFEINSLNYFFYIKCYINIFIFVRLTKIYIYEKNCTIYKFAFVELAKYLWSRFVETNYDGTNRWFG